MLTDAEKKELEALKSKAELTDDEKKRLSDLEAKVSQDGGTGDDDKTYSEAYVKKLREEAAKYRTKKNEAESMLAKFDGIDPEEYQNLKKMAAEKEKADMEKKGEWEKLRDQMTQAHAEELQKKDQEVTTLQETINNLESELNKTILSHEVAVQAAVAKAINPSLVEMVVMRKAKVRKDDDGRRVIEVLDASGNPKRDLKTGEPFTVGQLLEEMKQTEEYAHLFAGGTHGAGSKTVNFNGSKVQNPWKKESFNLTLQGQITQSNPTLAAQLKAEAGVK